ncbi:RICIN domain-containing protein [Cellulomonas sp. URHB0016]
MAVRPVRLVLSSVRAAVRRRVAGDPEGGIAMLTAILLIMVMTALSVLMLGVVTAQVRPTMFADKNGRTVFAAETGLDAALSQMRSALGAPDAITGKIYGNPAKLPCTVQGRVGAATSTLRYVVSVTYFDENPAGKDAAWRAAEKMNCSTTTGVGTAPSFALLSAEGLDAGVPGLATAQGDRAIETVYTFQVTNNNIAGGVIYAFGDKHCLKASGQTAGSKVTYQPASACRDDDPTVLWSYATDYKIHLAVTDLGGPTTAMCLTGNAGTGGNIEVTLQKCSSASVTQYFSWIGGAKWIGQKNDNSDYNNQPSPATGFCLNAGAEYSDTDLVGKTLHYSACMGNNVTSGSWDPDPRVGAGNASKASNQIVNFLEFGRCMDVTGANIAATFEISYPCKQDPSLAKTHVEWNHKWYYNEPTGLKGALANQTIKVNNGSDYCLQTPPATDNPAYPIFKTCSGAANQKWTRHAEESTYGDSWTFVDTHGRCISLGEKMSATEMWSKLIVAPCNNGPEQKWNAPANDQKARLDDLREIN